ncbi:hypothetical protein LMG28614_00303 [Paraburkholderia ultramafica]|uniref:Uncharacterized protein n=1 Tax=Paraburkholderia ultramafica TaxID=1544867 RepID=A0A6S7AVI2_9BURK|nr:hypothetical protein LMG28614_00303 [Paraburkholderia ultramafica]
MVPVIGGLIVGLIARFGSEQIRGHGIPEAIEAILFGKSKMSPTLPYGEQRLARVAERHRGQLKPFGDAWRLQFDGADPDAQHSAAARAPAVHRAFRVRQPICKKLAGPRS